MAEASTADSGAPNLNLSPEEKRVYGQLFRQADTDNVGVVTGEIAVKFFEKTRLDSRVLGEIWQIADKENRGFLTPAGFGIVLRLIGHAQAGREPTPEIALQQGPIPRFEGFTPAPPPLAPVPTGPIAQPIQAQGTGSGPIRIPPLTPEKVAQYAGLFERQPLQAGSLLPGDQAKQIFEKSGLPNEVLGRIWQLADTEQRGALVLTEFVIAMHLLTSMKTGTLRGLPSILPAALYEAATRRGPAAGARPQSPQTTGTAPLSAIPRQLSGQAGHQVQMRTGSPLGAHVRSPLAQQSTGDGWLITPADKTHFDGIFDNLDKAKRGFISGEEAVPFLKQSRLPEDTLAQIWDLADIRSEGHLNKDEFAVAMYLIRQQRGNRDGQNTLPATLPPNLMPPSLRGLARPPTATGPFDLPVPQQAPAPPPPQPKPVSALDDLFGLDSTPTPPAPIQSAMATGNSNPPNDPFAGATSPAAPGSPVRPSPTTSSTFKPFVPSSSFGRSIIPQATGDSQSSAGGFPKPAPPQPSVSDDLLGDADPEISKKLTNDTAELANLSNQIGSLSKQMQEVQGQRSATQTELNQASVQKKNFEQRLSQLRALYEKEAKDVRALQEQLTAARNDTKKIQTEMAMLDGTYQDLQNQHRTVLAGLQADQQENANLKERIRAVNAEVAALKPQIEKLKSEARQQKGLVAINKKQLATNEAEREKLKTEADELTKENEELARQLSQSPPPPAAAPPPQVASPAPSSASANNPFFRRTGSTDIMGAFASPGAKTFNDKSFDDVFGPSFPSSTPPPPATSFKPQNTGTSATSTGSFATPATSTTPNVSRQPTLTVEQPPAPPESRQMSPSFLPFGDPTESLTSSTQVSPPMSRLGPETPAVETPAAAVVPSPLEATATGQSATSASSRSDVKAPETLTTTNGAAAESAFGPSSITSEPKADDAAPEANSDPFSAVDQAKAKEDFESAFASFKASNPGKSAEKSNTDAAKGFATFDTEFPPISELERDDESDSDDDKGGFDDDFAPASPPGGKAFAQSSSPTLTKASVDDSTPVAANASPEISNDKPQPPPPTTSNTDADDIFGAAAPPPGSFPEPSPVPLSTTTNTAPPAASQPTTAPVSKQPSAFDDLDDEFADLEDAKEGSADDDFQTISRSGLDDFNPVFDSSPPASQSTVKSESTTGPSGGIAGTGAPFGTDSSYDFASLGSNSAATSNLGASTASTAQPPATGAKGPNPPESHDWDAIFASLDDAPASSPTTATAPAPKDTGNATRPDIGRALTEEGEHDDPILKNLTSMGYSRTDALSALEKYDYNLERAANYLASQS